MRNYKGFRQKVKEIVNKLNYGTTAKATKLIPVVGGWRNYQRFCKMDENSNLLYFIQKQTYQVFNPKSKQNTYSQRLLDRIFPAMPYFENKFVNVKGNKSPYDVEMAYWSDRDRKLDNDITSKALERHSPLVHLKSQWRMRTVTLAGEILLEQASSSKKASPMLTVSRPKIGK